MSRAAGKEWRWGVLTGRNDNMIPVRVLHALMLVDDLKECAKVWVAGFDDLGEQVDLSSRHISLTRTHGSDDA